MMITSLQRRMGVLFLAFFLLVSISVAATFWTIETVKQDALVINLTGRQRMLVQQMTKDALQLNQSRGGKAQAHSVALQEAARTFEQTLRALTAGGQAPYLPDYLVDVPATENPDILVGLQQVGHTWDAFRNYLDTVLTANPGSSEFTIAVEAVQQLSPLLVGRADKVVRLYEAASTRKIAYLRSIQGAFFASALGLLAIGFLIIQKSVIEPLRWLGISAARIGRGDLDTLVKTTGPREIEALSHSLDTMRAQLKDSQKNLESRVAQRTRELVAAFEFSQEIVADFNLDHLLSSVTDRARTLMRAQATALCLLAPNGRYLDLVASSGKTTICTDMRQSVGHGLPAQVVGGGQTIATEVACVNCAFLHIQRQGRCVATPLRAGEHILGALCVVRSEHERFDPEETRALTLLANSAAIAIANIRLVEAGQRHAEQAAALTERERLATELHDNLAQTLGFLNLKTDGLKELLTLGHTAKAETELDRMKPAIDQAYGQVRAALVGLREPMTDTEDLAKKLAAYVDDFRQTSGLPAKLIVDEAAALALPDVAQKQALHIVREALNNIRRHAQAQQAWVHVERVNDSAHFTVEDDGCGFHPTGIEGNNHLGLTIMRTRAERSGGHLVIDSTPGTGTKVVARFPLLQDKNGLNHPFRSFTL